jgi:hypothetical protein
LESVAHDRFQDKINLVAPEQCRLSFGLRGRVARLPVRSEDDQG